MSCQKAHGGILKSNKQRCFTMNCPSLKPLKTSMRNGIVSTICIMLHQNKKNY